MDVVCSPFSNVAANSKATAKWNNLLGYSIDRIILTLGGTFTKAQMTNIKLQANGKDIFNDTGSRIDSRMQYRGISAAAGFLTLDFSELRARTIIGQGVGAINTVVGGIRDLSVEIDIGGATNPTLSALAQVSSAAVPADQVKTAGLIGKVLNFNQNFAAAGEFPIEIPYGRQAGALIKRLFLFGSTVTAARAKKNGIEIFNRSDALNDFIQGENQRVPQSNIYGLDFIEDGNMSKAHNAANAQTHEWYVTVNGSGNVGIVAELLDPLANN